MRNLRKLFYVACAVFFFTSCEETYNDKLFWPGEISQEYGSYIKPYTLDLTYSGEKLVGKTVSFKTGDSETGTLTLNDVIPGEKETPISHIQLYENEEKGYYTFSGTNITMGGATVKYSGSITPKTMKLDLNVVMADPQKLVNKYDFALYEMVQDLTNEFHPVQYKGACYFDMKPKEGIGTDEASLMYLLGNLAPGILQTLIPQLIKDIKLEKDGTITAYYSSDPINEELLFLPLNGDEAEVVQKQIQTVIENRTYEKSPNGLAYWGQANNKLILKLNIPAIITEIIKNSQQQIDGELINGITEAILKTDPIRLKSLLSTLNAIVNNDILGYLVMVDDASFTALFNCIKNGIPMNITHTKDGHTYLYLGLSDINSCHQHTIRN
ncbi:DUF4925 domain-containing protein [Bacteroides ovatus]|nr:DUF4925 domain-containing protein [Bacteroides ovatus]